MLCWPNGPPCLPAHAVFLEEALPQALRLAAQASRDLRRSLPREYFEYMGVAHEKEVEEPGGWMGSPWCGAWGLGVGRKRKGAALPA